MSKVPSNKARHAATSRARRMAFKRRNRVRCEYCGKGLTPQTATADHKHPIALGGSNKQKNLVIACAECNQRKGAMAHGTFIALLRAEGKRL